MDAVRKQWICDDLKKAREVLQGERVTKAEREFASRLVKEVLERLAREGWRT